MIDRRRFLAPLAAMALAGPVAAAPKAYRAPRTPWGAPNLQGYWTNASYTELERPKALKSLVATPEEARAWEAKLARTRGVDVPSDPVGQVESEFPETGSGLARINGEIRTSWIVDPPDGQIPWSDAAIRDLQIGGPAWRQFDGPEERSHNERCLAAASTGAPILSSEDANLLQIVQTPTCVVLVTEKYHDARIVRLPGSAAPHGPRGWLGDSVGRWDGATLEVVTDNLPDGVIGHGDDLYLSGQSRVVERFTRIGPKRILYGFTVSDPYLFKRPWRGEMVFDTSKGAPFEYACHEGNYSLPSILSAARQGHQPGPPKPAASSGGADAAGDRP